MNFKKIFALTLLIGIQSRIILCSEDDFYAGDCPTKVNVSIISSKDYKQVPDYIASENNAIFPDSDIPGSDPAFVIRPVGFVRCYYEMIPSSNSKENPPADMYRIKYYAQKGISDPMQEISIWYAKKGEVLHSFDQWRSDKGFGITTEAINLLSENVVGRYSIYDFTDTKCRWWCILDYTFFVRKGES